VEIQHLYLRAIEVSPQIAQNFQKPEMHTCARYLLLELIKSRNFSAARSLLADILEDPNVAFQQILLDSFLHELGKSAMEEGNYRMAIRLFTMTERPDEAREWLRTQEANPDLGISPMEENNLNHALDVFEKAKKALSKEYQRIQEECGNATEKIKKGSRPIVTPTEDEKAIPRAVPKETAKANTGPKATKAKSKRQVGSRGSLFKLH
jgi:hypothetical protein